MTRDQETSAAWMWICLAHTARCLADRSYSFFLPLFFSSQCTSSALRPTATVTIVQNLAVALLSTTVAKLYDKSGKGGFEVFTKATLLENLAVAAGGSIIYSTFQGEKSNLDTNGGMSVCDSPLSDKAFVFYLCFSAIDAVSNEGVRFQFTFHERILYLLLIQFLPFKPDILKLPIFDYFERMGCSSI